MGEVAADADPLDQDIDRGGAVGGSGLVLDLRADPVVDGLHPGVSGFDAAELAVRQPGERVGFAIAAGVHVGQQIGRDVGERRRRRSSCRSLRGWTAAVAA